MQRQSQRAIGLIFALVLLCGVCFAAHVRIESAVKNGSQIEARITVQAASGAHAFTAVYNESGKMIAVREAILQGGTWTIAESLEAAERVKAFVFDENAVPLGASDEALFGLIRVSARSDFAFRADTTNKASGETVPITADYYLAEAPVTNAEYQAFVLATEHKAPSYWNGTQYPEGKADHPVVNVSHSDAVAYCRWLSAQHTGWTFRLPTEAEWENAAMGAYYGDDSVKYPAGGAPSYDGTTLTTNFNYNGVTAARLFAELGANYTVNYIKGDYAGKSETLGQCISISESGGVSNWANHGGSATKGYFLQTDLYAELAANGGNTAPVKAYPANTLGFYDMAGNSWDLTDSLIVAQNGLEKGVECYAVRGGSWYATARSCTFSYRGEGRKDSPSATVGFRVAADVP